MRKAIALLTLAALLPSAALAEDTVNLLKCPAVPEAYSKMLTELNLLKTAIKRDAACEPVQSEVESLEKLLGERRTRVNELVKKNKTEPLTAEELEEVRTYVEDITKKVFSTAELLNRNNYCFAEDRQKFGLSDLASLTLDATAIAKTVSGPWAAPIALGGQALAGIMRGLDSMIKSRRGYDFEKLEQRQSFVQSLCSYYNYRQDIEHVLYPRRRAGQLTNLNKALRTTLQGMKDNCDDCRRISDLAAEGEHIDPRAVSEINQIAKKADGEYIKPLGTYTIQTLANVSWVRGEMNRLKEEVADEASIGRDLVSEMKTDIDRFLFEREAPRFIHFQNRKAMDLFREFNEYVKKEGQKLLLASWAYVKPDRYTPSYAMDEQATIKQVTALVPALKAKGQNSLVYRITDYERKSADLLERTVLALDVQLAYCSFFQQAGVYNADLQTACDSMVAGSVQRNLTRLKDMVGPGLLPEKPAKISADWADGMTQMLTDLNKDPNRFRRRR